jgi:hypothetical protein
LPRALTWTKLLLASLRAGCPALLEDFSKRLRTNCPAQTPCHLQRATRSPPAQPQPLRQAAAVQKEPKMPFRICPPTSPREKSNVPHFLSAAASTILFYTLTIPSNRIPAARRHPTRYE